MATAICDQGHTTDWRQKRGHRLADVRCGVCGQAGLYPATYRDGHWVRREFSKRPKKKRRQCAICGCKFMVPAESEGTREARCYILWRDDDHVPVYFPVGSYICRFHGDRQASYVGRSLACYHFGDGCTRDAFELWLYAGIDEWIERHRHA